MIPNNKISELKKYINDNEIVTLEKIFGRVEYEEYFFRTKSDTKWLMPLIILDYFNPRNNPSPISADKEGYYSIPTWIVLPYLEKISEAIGKTLNISLTNELLKIIENVTSCVNEKGEHSDNYRTWWYFTKILLNLPNDKISSENLSTWLPIWLDSKFDTTLQGHDIALKLLPKFLASNNADDINKIEVIVENILSFKDTSFNKKRKNNLAVEYYWVEELFSKYGQRIGEACSKELIFRLSNRIKPLLYENTSEVEISIEGKTYLFTLTLLENQYNGNIRIQWIDKAREDIHKLYLSGEKIEWIDIALLTVSNISINSLDNLLNEIRNNQTANSIFKEINEDSLRNNLFWMITKIFDSNTHSSFYVKGHPRFNTLDLFTEVLKFILNAKCAKNISEAQEILESYLKDDYMYFRKLALYVIGNHVQLYKNIFFKYLETDKYNLILDGIFFGDEIGELFKHLTELTSEEKKLLRNKIEQGCILHSRMSEEDNILWKQERYQALSHIPEFRILYDEIQNKTKMNVKLRPAVGEVQSGFVNHTSPINHEDLIKMSVDEVVKYIKEYKPTEGIQFFKIEGVQGLAGELSKAIEKDPNKYVDKLNYFQSLGYYYIYNLIGTFRNLWKNKTVLELNKVLSFIKNYVSSPDFGKPNLIVPKDGWNADHLWVIGMIGEFIQDGTGNDEWAFGEEFLNHIKEILFICLNMIEPTKKSKNNDPVTDALNTHQGKIIRALIYYALRVARLNKNKYGEKEVNWEDDIRTKYEEVLKKDIIDAYTLFGQYLPQLSYLDRGWVRDKIKVFESLYENKVDLWEYFMTGYLYGQNVSNIIFDQMKVHYVRGLDFEFKNTHAAEGIIHHIAIGYLREIPNGNELYEKFINDWKASQFEAFIRFLWIQIDYLLKDDPEDKEKDIKMDMIDKIKMFWKYIYDKNKDKTALADEDIGILSDMCLIISYLAPIDENNKKWIMVAARYVENRFNSTQFIESLNKIKDIGEPEKTAGYVGEIFKAMLDTSTPTFPEDAIKEIVEFIYRNNRKSLADDICIKYGSRGSDMLRGIWEKNNPKSIKPVI